MIVSIDCMRNTQSTIESNMEMSFSYKDNDSVIWCKVKCVSDYLDYIINNNLDVDKISFYITDGYKSIFTLKTSKSSFDKEQCELLKIKIVKEFFKLKNEI